MICEFFKSNITADYNLRKSNVQIDSRSFDPVEMKFYNKRRDILDRTTASSRARTFHTPIFILQKWKFTAFRGIREKNSPLSLYGRKVVAAAAEFETPKTASPPCSRGRLLLGRHEEVRSDNNEFRCRPFRPPHSASRKVSRCLPLRHRPVRSTVFLPRRCGRSCQIFIAPTSLSRTESRNRLALYGTTRKEGEGLYFMPRYRISRWHPFGIERSRRITMIV